MNRAVPIMLLFLPIILLRISFTIPKLFPIKITFNLKQLLIKYTT